ncbi:hypothetical protein PAXRUDRAFT_499566 [Paxillus rubicundulus Ve08.2h10]|uniref:Uncharacterized protein n=1 Tax=Paxillus rubicundulus Ve08.2h10 TaxID=930991 RepID=A0A0D0CJ82_9AGAM|nr:hypothetical protein PAXRUDRAFT_499566 [Paxillus rubicundulus Ve08.2h10]
MTTILTSVECDIENATRLTYRQSCAHLQFLSGHGQIDKNVHCSGSGGRIIVGQQHLPSVTRRAIKSGDDESEPQAVFFVCARGVPFMAACPRTTLVRVTSLSGVCASGCVREVSPPRCLHSSTCNSSGGLLIAPDSYPSSSAFYSAAIFYEMNKVLVRLAVT